MKRSESCQRCELDCSRCRCAPIDRTLHEDALELEAQRRRSRSELTNALRSWAHASIDMTRPLAESKARAYPFLAAADELDGRSCSGWCAAYLEPVVAVLERELRARPRCWALSFRRVSVAELERGIEELRRRAVPLYESRREAAE